MYFSQVFYCRKGLYGQKIKTKNFKMENFFSEMIKIDTLNSEPIAVNDLAARVKVDARYLREWCEGLHLSGYIDCDKLTDPVKARN